MRPWFGTMWQLPPYLSYPYWAWMRRKVARQSSPWPARQSRMSSIMRRTTLSAGAKAMPVSKSLSMSSSTKACASIAARTWAPWTASPSWETLPARRAKSAARSGSPGHTMAQPSMKICAPICSATTLPFSAALPLRGASMPAFKRRYAVCSVELPRPPHHRMVRPSMR